MLKMLRWEFGNKYASHALHSSPFACQTQTGKFILNSKGKTPAKLVNFTYFQFTLTNCFMCQLLNLTSTKFLRENTILVTDQTRTQGHKLYVTTATPAPVVLTLISTLRLLRLNLICRFNFSTIGVNIFIQFSFKGVYL